MEYTLNDKYTRIKEDVVKEKSISPVTIAKKLMRNDYISMHGPEHHYLDGAAFLVAYKNAGGEVDLEYALNELANRAMKMPGAMCGHWGVCGSVASVGAALSIIHHTGPLNDDQYYADHMAYTSGVIQRMSTIGGPRCCKRNAYTALNRAVVFVKDHYGIVMEGDVSDCEFSQRNLQCIEERCPYHPSNSK